MLHLATWNVNSLKIRVDHLQKWTAEAQPDVLCLQELKCADEQVPVDALVAMGYPHVVFAGQKTYNGVAILSKRPLTDVRAGFAIGDPDPQSRLIRATVDLGGRDLRVFCCYVPNGQAVGSDKFVYKLAWLDRLRAEIAGDGPPDRWLAVAGDMNVALDDASVWDPFGADGEVMYHPLERERIRAILDWGLVDSYRALKPDGREYTWWDYRMLGFQKNHGYRIDHVFLTKPLLERCREVAVARPVRKWDKPSDHVPLSVRLDL